MSFKRITLCIALYMLTILSYGQTSGTHTVLPGETLTSISAKYNVSIDAIRKLNNINGDMVRAGEQLKIPASSKSVPSTKVQPSTSPATSKPESVPAAKLTTPDTPKTTSITPSTFIPTTPKEQSQKAIPSDYTIPKCKLTHITESKTTVKDICDKFKITESQFYAVNPDIKKSKIKKGTSLCIPYNDDEIATMKAEIAKAQAEEARRMEEAERARKEAEAAKKRYSTINLALILPFELAQQSKSAEAIKMIDFYEGLLLAIDDLKTNGANVVIDVYDEKESSIEEILSKIGSKPCQLIIGAKSQENINVLREYCKQHGITLAVPFSSQEQLTVNYPTLFQVNSKASSLFPEVYSQFISSNRQNNIVFVNSSDGEETSYIDGFQNALSQNGLSFSIVPVSLLADYAANNTYDRKTVLIPSSKTVKSFTEIVSVLDSLDIQTNSKYTIFGYPEYQTFSTENTSKLTKYHCSFYATFYANLTSSEVLTFNTRFKNQFKRDQYNTRPLYGLLGYDVTKYFIGGLQKYGSDFIPMNNYMKIDALQNQMNFERNGSSSNGFINKNIRIIQF